MSINFPADRTEAGIAGGGALVINDQWYSTATTTLYTVVAFNDANEIVWKGNTNRRTGDSTLQEVLNEGNTANDAGDNIDFFELTRTGSGLQKLTNVQPGSINLKDETTSIGPRIVFNSSNDGNFEGRISVKDDERLTLETSNNEGIWVKDGYISNSGSQVQRVFRIEPNEEEFAVGVYSILDPLFGGATTETWNIGDPAYETNADGTPYTVAQPYTRDNWSMAFNRAMQNNPIRPLSQVGINHGTTGLPLSATDENFVAPSVVLTNGDIKTLIFPAGEYLLHDPVMRKEVVTLVGEGIGVTKFIMEEREEDVANAAKIVLWRMLPTTYFSDGSSHSGQFCLANKGNVTGISFVGHQSASASEGDATEYAGDSDVTPGEDDQTRLSYSTVLAFRAYDNYGNLFYSDAHVASNPLDDNGYDQKKQQDSADMDTKFINCGFGSKGKGGKRNGLLKYVGRNAYISNCTFNSNYTGIVLTFPNRAGHDLAAKRLGISNIGALGADDPTLCNINDSLSNENQGGVYGWRRIQILGCTFHMNKKAHCIRMFGKFQCSGMIIDGCLSDIGGQLLEVDSTGPTGGNVDNGNVYNNGVGGGLKNCVISNNSFGNQTSNGAYITFIDGRFDGNIITGNSFYGNDDTYLHTDCNTFASPNGTVLKRCDHAITIKIHGVASETGAPASVGGDNPNGRDCVIRGLVITNNNFSYFTDHAINVLSENVKGLIVSNNSFYNIGCPEQDTSVTPPTMNLGNPDAVAVRVEHNTAGIISNNVLIQETDGLANPFGTNFFKTTTGPGNNPQGNTSSIARSGQILSNNIRIELPQTTLPGTT